MTESKGEHDHRTRGSHEDAADRLLMDETEPRALGLPLRWFRNSDRADLRWIRHPVRWLRWRSEVRRLGPHARRYDEFDPKHNSPG
jgi:hypothetical protein